MRRTSACAVGKTRRRISRAIRRDGSRLTSRYSMAGLRRRGRLRHPDSGAAPIPRLVGVVGMPSVLLPDDTQSLLLLCTGLFDNEYSYQRGSAAPLQRARVSM